jgi:hypothetical protein
MPDKDFTSVLQSYPFQPLSETIGFQVSTEPTLSVIDLAQQAGKVLQLRLVYINTEEDANIAYVAFGGSDVVAIPWTAPPPANCSFPMLPNTGCVVTLPVSPEPLYVSVVLFAGNGGFYVTQGVGQYAG